MSHTAEVTEPATKVQPTRRIWLVGGGQNSNAQLITIIGKAHSVAAAPTIVAAQTDADIAVTSIQWIVLGFRF